MDEQFMRAGRQDEHSRAASAADGDRQPEALPQNAPARELRWQPATGEDADRLRQAVNRLPKSGRQWVVAAQDVLAGRPFDEARADYMLDTVREGKIERWREQMLAIECLGFSPPAWRRRSEAIRSLIWLVERSLGAAPYESRFAGPWWLAGALGVAVVYGLGAALPGPGSYAVL